MTTIAKITAANLTRRLAQRVVRRGGRTITPRDGCAPRSHLLLPHLTPGVAPLMGPATVVSKKGNKTRQFPGGTPILGCGAQRPGRAQRGGLKGKWRRLSLSSRRLRRRTSSVLRARQSEFVSARAPSPPRPPGPSAGRWYGAHRSARGQHAKHRAPPGRRRPHSDATAWQSR
jgi:hypothetical protein